MTRAILALALAAALPAAAAAQTDGPPLTGQITVTGTGAVDAKPDLARISVGVTEEAASAEAAAVAMSEKARAVIARLESAGIPAADIRTGQLRLEPRVQYDDGGRGRPDGFTATTMLEVEPDDLDALGGVLDAAVGEGANRIDGISFDLADRADALEAARRAAVADARARAELYADAAEVTLGALIQLSEGGGGGGPMPEARIAMAADSMPVAPGQITISATVTMTYAIDE